MSEDAPAPLPPSPTPLGAITLTGLAWIVMVLVTVFATPSTGGTLGLAFGTALGLGGAGTLAARALPAPAERRIGLTGFAPGLLLPLLLLVPAVLLTSEVDNWLQGLFPGAEPAAPEAPAPDALATLELVLFAVLLRPVLEEFFFRGVLQQGVVAALGPGRGLVLVAVLFALVRASFGLGDAYRATTLGAQALVEGLLLGSLRLASGSILPGVALAMAMGAVGFAALAARERFPIPGFTGDGHTPLVWLAPAALSVALALALLVRSARSR